MSVLKTQHLLWPKGSQFQPNGPRKPCFSWYLLHDQFKFAQSLKSWTIFYSWWKELLKMSKIRFHSALWTDQKCKEFYETHCKLELFFYQKLFWSKFVFNQNNFAHNCFGICYFWHANFFPLKFLWTKSLCTQNNFFTQNILDTKFILYPKYCWTQNFSGMIFFHPKCFVKKKIPYSRSFYPKKLIPKIILITVLDPKYFVETNFVWTQQFFWSPILKKKQAFF